MADILLNLVESKPPIDKANNKIIKDENQDLEKTKEKFSDYIDEKVTKSNEELEKVAETSIKSNENPQTYPQNEQDIFKTSPKKDQKKSNENKELDTNLKKEEEQDVLNYISDVSNQSNKQETKELANEIKETKSSENIDKNKLFTEQNSVIDDKNLGNQKTNLDIKNKNNIELQKEDTKDKNSIKPDKNTKDKEELIIDKTLQKDSQASENQKEIKRSEHIFENLQNEKHKHTKELKQAKEINIQNINTLQSSQETTKTLAKEIIEPQAKNLTPKDTALQLQKEINFLINKEKETATIKLHPKELGELTIKIQLKENVVNVNFAVENNQAKEQISNSLNRLKTIFLENQNEIELGDTNVFEKKQNHANENENFKENQFNEAESLEEIALDKKQTKLNLNNNFYKQDNRIDFYI